MRRRMEVSEEEAAILAGLRHERDIWNKALEAAMIAIVTALNDDRGLTRDAALQEAQVKILELRKS